MNVPELTAIISAGSALFMAYMYRSQGKGFVWTNNQNVGLFVDRDGRIHLQIEIPLFNFGKRTLQFISLKAKKVNMKTKAMENFEMDMHEAHFPEGVAIVTYRTTIFTEIFPDTADGQKIKLLIAGSGDKLDKSEAKVLQNKLNQKLKEIPEHIIVLKCLYKDGSWFGKGKKETVIGLSISDQNINYLSSARRKELNDYFSW